MTRPIVYLAAGLAIVSAFGCSPLEPDPEAVQSSSIISVDAALDPQDATGSQLVSTVRATLPAEATLRNVTFTASGGLFVENGTKTIVVRAEPNADSTKMIATTRLSDTISRVVIVRGAIADRYDTTLVSFIRKP